MREGIKTEGVHVHDLIGNRSKRVAGRGYLTAEQRYEIQLKRGEGMTAKELALEYNVTAGYVYSLSPVYM